MKSFKFSWPSTQYYKSIRTKTAKARKGKPQKRRAASPLDEGDSIVDIDDPPALLPIGTEIDSTENVLLTESESADDGFNQQAIDWQVVEDLSVLNLPPPPISLGIAEARQGLKATSVMPSSCKSGGQEPVQKYKSFRKCYGCRQARHLVRRESERGLGFYSRSADNYRSVETFITNTSNLPCTGCGRTYCDKCKTTHECHK